MKFNHFREIDYFGSAGSDCTKIEYFFRSLGERLVPNTSILFSLLRSYFLISHPFCTKFMYVQRLF